MISVNPTLKCGVKCGVDMARGINKLSAMMVNKIAVAGMYGDGAGLYLLVSPSLSKSWIFRYTMEGKQREMGLGALHTISLAEARALALEARKLIQQGVCPLSEKKRLRARKKLDDAKTKLFKDCAVAYIQSHKKGWKNAKHLYQWERTLEMYVYPVLGELAVADISTELVIRCLEPIWSEKSETATRVRQRIEVVWDWAKVMGYCVGENPARWRGHLDHLLPARRKVAMVKHHEALPYALMAVFMERLRGVNTVGAKALELAILTASRTGEVIGARWDEFNLDEKLWIIPPERMKAKREHRVALSSDAVALLEQLAAHKTGAFLFSSPHADKPISNMTMMMAKRRIFTSAALPEKLKGFEDITPHGFRSTFRDWVSEATNYPSDMAEMALAHTLTNKVEAAYRRGDALEKRRQMMEDWAKWCAGCEILDFKPQIAVVK